MHNYIVPLVDEDNPMYCPAIPAATYRKELTQKLAGSTDSDLRNRSHSFGYLLEQSFCEESNNDGSIRPDRTLGDYFPASLWFSSQPPEAEELPTYSPTVPGRAQSVASQILDMSPNSASVPIVTPPKCAQPLLSVHDSSFDMELLQQKFQFNGVTKPSPTDMTHASRDGFPGSKPDLDKLVEKLDSALPSVRLKDRLRKPGLINPQSLMDFLCIHGNSHYH